ncbi:DUF3617 domain-containing protein [Thiohalophilus sp.]|uniref:DUF3617 domain-containing protein n=1 Tax=Thiohalophilus sp. TaxID=3028392 RepID=UPI003974E87B
MTLSILGLLLLNFQLLAADYNIQPGLWEMTYKMELSGVPKEMAQMMQREPQTKRQCVEGDEIDFKPNDMGQGCNFTTTHESANRVAWDIQCRGEHGASSGQGEVNFNRTTTQGWFEMNIQAGPIGEMQMRNTFEGKRVGSC